MLKIDALSRSEQHYIRAIYMLTREARSTGTMEIAASLNVKPASVTNMLQKLNEREPHLIDYQKHDGVLLTAEGEQMALQILRRHRLIEQFLQQFLGYSWDLVHPEADALEHVVSPYFEERIAALLGDPQFDPHGDPIPSRSLDVQERAGLVQLSGLGEGKGGLVRWVSDQRPELLGYLESIGLQPGVFIEVVRRNPMDGAASIHVGGGEHVLGNSIQDAVWVETQG